ncbi:hypothetical protein TrLO_g13556 [Triparma laevis f. longispina]|uniref:Uncharacterized protein n=1 Tax=Triparma laevis f. longispina TaxID=1714387 RepID=A0A9W7C714_9STRA|nr:hypothetical protein TrLO_g13556 [Triparma laevis f. longispina]
MSTDNIDIEIGGLSDKVSNSAFRNSKTGETSAFRDQIKAQWEDIASKGQKTDATDAVNTEALGKAMGEGGVHLERLNIAISFFQSFGLVGMLKLPWPESFRKIFLAWLELFSFNFTNYFEGMGKELTVASGLLVQIWLIWELDCGLYRERTKFAFMFGLPLNEVGMGLFNGCCTLCTGTFIVLAIVGVVDSADPNMADASIGLH